MDLLDMIGTCLLYMCLVICALLMLVLTVWLVAAIIQEIKSMKG